MCGISGFIDVSRATTRHDMMTIATKMARAILHRGPNHQGIWVDECAGVALGHRRLSIIDCSPRGQQPMHSHDKRYVMVYNGEIYNFQALRSDLEKLGQVFLSVSDTEVLLSAFSVWGIAKTLEKINGMFAIALFDRQEQRFYLIRDRIGQKPLYYAKFGPYILFGSELKALRQHPKFEAAIDRAALASYTQYAYVPTPQTIYHNTFKLQPAHYLNISVSQGVLEPPICYWDHQAIAVSLQNNVRADSLISAEEQLHDLLKTAIKMRMMSDVPLGAFLSGGIDSSLIVALMQQCASHSVKTFTIGFEEVGFNEANEARAVAQHLGTDHTEVYISQKNVLSIIPKLHHIYDEPFSDVSQIPTYLVSEIARQQVTVALSGDGGDEFFAGYRRYFIAPMLWKRFAYLPTWLKILIVKAFRMMPESSWDYIFSFLNRLGLFKTIKGNLSDKVKKFSHFLDCRHFASVYSIFVSISEPQKNLVLGVEEAFEYDAFVERSSLNELHTMLLADAHSYLPDDILVKVDRASMAVSLEVRSPLLDYRVVEYAWSLPTCYKVHGDGGKRLLKKVLSRYVPPQLTERPKMGFGVPIGLWLRSDALKTWAADLLDSAMLRRQGYLNADIVEQKWKEHRSGKHNHQSFLWNMLMFQSWLCHNS